MFELTSEILDVDFQFDFEDCNICQKSKYLNETPSNFKILSHSIGSLVCIFLINDLSMSELKVKSVI